MFLAKPENVAKIDIPGKLHRYMHLPEGHKTEKQTGKSYVGRKNELFQPEAWREGENSQGFREKGGSAMTSSEMRHAIRMGENSTVHFVGGAEI